MTLPSNQAVVYFVDAEISSKESGPTGRIEQQCRCVKHANLDQIEACQTILKDLPPGADPHDWSPVHCEEDSCHVLIGFTANIPDLN